MSENIGGGGGGGFASYGGGGGGGANITPGSGAEPQAPAAIQETVEAERVVQGTVIPDHTVTVSVLPTQVRRPWRATVRTVFAVVVAIAAMAYPLVEASGVEETLAPVAGFLAISGGITRVMALPQVEAFLTRFLPFLAATPKETNR